MHFCIAHWERSPKLIIDNALFCYFANVCYVVGIIQSVCYVLMRFNVIWCVHCGHCVCQRAKHEKSLVFDSVSLEKLHATFVAGHSSSPESIKLTTKTNIGLHRKCESYMNNGQRLIVTWFFFKKPLPLPLLPVNEIVNSIDSMPVLRFWGNECTIARFQSRIESDRSVKWTSIYKIWVAFRQCMIKYRIYANAERCTNCSESCTKRNRKALQCRSD